MIQSYRSTGDGMEASPADDSDPESPEAEGSLRKPRSSSSHGYKSSTARSPQPSSRSHARAAMSSGTPVASQDRPPTADMSPAPTGSGMIGKRRTARTGSPSDSPKPASSAQSQAQPGEDRKDRGQMNRSSTTPSLRSHVDLRSKSRGSDGKAKEARTNDRADGRSPQVMPSQEQAAIDNKNSPQQAFRVLPGRFSAPPTPRRHTPRAPKRTPRLSPRATFPQQLKPKDNEELRRQAQAWDRDREDRIQRQMISEVDGRTQRLNSEIDRYKRQASKGAGGAVDSARSTGSAHGLVVRPAAAHSVHHHSSEVTAAMPLQAGHQDWDAASSTLGPASTPPMPSDLDPRRSHASTAAGKDSDAAVDANAYTDVWQDQHGNYYYNNGILYSGNESASDSSDLPRGPYPRDGKHATYTQSVVDNSRMLRLIGRRSVLSQPTPVLGAFTQQQAQPQRQQRTASMRMTVPGSPSSPPKPESGVRGQRLSTGQSTSIGPATARSEAGGGETSRYSARTEPDGKRRNYHASLNDENSSGGRIAVNDENLSARSSIPSAASQQASEFKRPHERPQDEDKRQAMGLSNVNNAEMRQAFGASQADMTPAEWESPSAVVENSGTEPASGKEGGAPSFGLEASGDISGIGVTGQSMISLMPEYEETATSPSTSTAAPQAGSHSTSTAEVPSTADAAHQSQQVDTALQEESVWYKDAGGTEAGPAGAVIWPGRPGAKQEAAPAQPQTQAQAQQAQAQAQSQTQLAAQLQQLAQYGQAVAAGSSSTAGAASWGYAEQQMALAETHASYSLAVNGHVSFPVQPMMQNEVGSLVMPTTWRYLQPPLQMLQQPAAPEQDESAQEAASSPSRPSQEAVGSCSASSQAEEAGSVIIRQVASDRDTDVPSAEEAPVFEPMDLEAKRLLLSDLVEHLTAKAAKAEQALGSEQRANHAMRVTLEVLQRQNLHLQQQLWVTQNWPYANMANMC